MPGPGSQNPAPVVYDPRDPAVIADPLPALRHLQDNDPVHWSPLLSGWVITRYDDVKKIQNNREISADRLTPFYEHAPEETRRQIHEVIRYLNTWVAFKDPPDHTRMRNIMNQILTPGDAERLRPNIESIVAHLLEGLEGRTEFDFINDFANPLPAAVIMDLLGLPREDFAILKTWSEMIQPFIGNATVSDNKYALAEEGAVGMANYFRGIIALREKNPGEDRISALLALRDRGEPFTEDEIIGTCILFLFAGHETTTNLIGNGIRLLLKYPDQLDRLRRDPALIESAVEECLRYDGPTGALVRIVKVTHEMHGKTLKEGDRVFVMINAANHDPRRFDKPELFDITRSPNRHLTFNFGPHFCLGAQIARLEGQIAIGAIVRRYPDLRLKREVEYMDTLVMRGTRSMPVAVGG